MLKMSNQLRVHPLFCTGLTKAQLQAAFGIDAAIDISTFNALADALNKGASGFGLTVLKVLFPPFCVLSQLQKVQGVSGLLPLLTSFSMALGSGHPPPFARYCMARPTKGTVSSSLSAYETCPALQERHATW